MNNEATDQESDIEGQANRQSLPPDKTAMQARIALIAGLTVIVAGVIYSAVAGLGWLNWMLSHAWLLVIALLVIGLLGLFLLSVSSQKNIAWRQLNAQFGQAFGETLDRKNFSTGRGLIGHYAYLGLRCFGAPSGLEVGRIVSFVNPPLYIPWAAISKIDTFPSLLTGRKEFETDMQAQITLRDQPDLQLELPWLSEYRQLLPKSVKYRAIKLTKK